MLDVIHFFMEEDLATYTGEHMQARDASRTTIYQQLYNQTYKYRMKQKESSGPADGSWDIPQDFMSDGGVTKPYVPPTDFNPDSFLPFGSGIDAPME